IDSIGSKSLSKRYGTFVSAGGAKNRGAEFVFICQEVDEKTVETTVAASQLLDVLGPPDRWSRGKDDEIQLDYCISSYWHGDVRFFNINKAGRMEVGMGYAGPWYWDSAYGKAFSPWVNPATVPAGSQPGPDTETRLRRQWASEWVE